MPITIEYNDAMRIIEIVHLGILSGQEMRDSTTEAIILSKKHGVNNFLMDSTDAEGVESIVDIFELPEKQYFEEGVSRLSRAALVLPKSPDARQYSEFYKTVCTNRGWIVQLFETRVEAVDWLTSSYSSNKADPGDA